MKRFSSPNDHKSLSINSPINSDHHIRINNLFFHHEQRCTAENIPHRHRRAHCISRVVMSKHQIINIIAPGRFVNAMAGSFRLICRVDGQVDSSMIVDFRSHDPFTRPSTGQLGQYWVSTGSVLGQY